MEFQSPSVVFFSIIIILFSLINIVKELQKSKTKKLPPGPPKLPLIGNLLQVAGLMPHRVLKQLAQKYGPLMHLQLGGITAIVISSPKIAKQVLKTHDLALADRPKLTLAKIVLADCRGIVLQPHGDHWRQIRKICTSELLSDNKVITFRSIREEEAWNLTESVKSSIGSPINVSEKFYKLANGITCRCTIGRRCKYEEDLIKLVKEIAYYGGYFFLADLYPSLKFLPVLTGMNRSLKKIRRKLDYICDNIIREHKEKLAGRKEGTSVNAEEEDLVDVLLRINQAQRFEFPITSNDIQALILDMVTAGTDTSSAVLEWTMAELIKNPRVMKKVQTEVREVLKGKERIVEADLQGLSYLKLVIKETLRLRGPAPLLLPRECKTECEIEGYTIPVKTKVIVNAWAMARDPEYWEDAESYLPERFETSSVDYRGANFEYIPFGAGRRMCAGITFGVATIELPLAQLLYYFDWKLAYDVKPEDLDMDESYGATTKRKNNLFLVATPHVPSPDSSA